MKVTIIQSDVLWGQPHQNRTHAEQLLNTAGASDLYVLPEMFTTGFATQPLPNTEPSTHNETLHWMQTQATMRNAALAASIAVTERESQHYFNRFYFVTPHDGVWVYDKRHLFSYGGEHLHYTKGHQRVVVEWRGVRYLLQICYDLRFPVFSRQTFGNHYDAILYVANWPRSRQTVWKTLLQARAIENQVYVVGVNRVGHDTACHYAGHSMIVDPYGHIIAQCADDTEDTATADLNLAQLQDFRRKFNVLDDADHFDLQID